MDKCPPDSDFFFVLERHQSNDTRDIEIARAKQLHYQLLNMFEKLKKSLSEASCIKLLITFLITVL